MALVKIDPKPGFNSQLTQTANENGWFTANLVRWRLGLLEKIAGWQKLVSSQPAGLVRAMHAWLDLGNNKNLLLGTDGGPQLLVNTTIYDLTLATVSVGGGSTSVTTTLANFSVTIGTTLVTVVVPTTFSIFAEDTVTFLMPISIGGRLLAAGSSVTVASVATGLFRFNMTSNAIYTENTAVGLPLFSFPFANNTATVTFKRHGLSPGGSFHIDRTTSFSSPGQGKHDRGSLFLSIPGGSDLVVLATPTVDTFTFVWTPYGSGSLATTIYEGETQNNFGDTVSFSNVLSSLHTSTLATVPPTSQSWFADNLGENGLLLFAGSALYVYYPPIQSGSTLDAAGNSTTPPTAPQINTGMIAAMPQAQVIVWGTEAVFGSGLADPLLLRWTDAGADPNATNAWTPLTTNQAGSYRLSHGSKIVGGTQAPQNTLIWTDTDIWSMSYISPPLVYGFNVIGTGCGLSAPKAFATLGRTTYWQSTNGFWQVSDAGVQPLACPVWDAFFRDLDTENISKCFGAANSSAHEVMFYYPSLQTIPTPPTNQLSFSQLFAQTAVWARVGVKEIDVVTAPDGTSTANLIVEDTGLGLHNVSQTISKPTTATSYVASIYCKNTSSRNLSITVTNPGLATANAIFNPATGAVVSSALSGVGFSAFSTSTSTDTYATGLAGNGWLRYNVFVTSDNGAQLVFEIDNANGSSLSYTGGGASGVIIWGAQLSLAPLANYAVNAAFITTNECSRYVKYNAAEGLWDLSDPGEGLPSLQRTSWIDNSIFGTPLATDFSPYIQQHEVGYDDDGDPMQNVYAETGYGRMDQGSTILSITQCQPDMKWFGDNGAVNIVLKTVQYPGGPVTRYGPYSVTPTTQFFSMRVRAKQVALRYEWAALTGYSARVGATSFLVKPAGTRP